jgi:hypothetical protein
MSKVIKKVACKFGRDDVRTVRFSAGPKQVRVTCKGKPALIIRPGSNGKFIAFCNTEPLVAVREFTLAGTPAAAYRQAVRRFWK